MKKILQIDVNYKYSSTGKLVELLHKNINNFNYETFVLYGRGKYIKERNVLKFSFDIETIFHALLTRFIGLTGFFSFFSTYRLLNKIRKIKPDLVHIHELHGYFVNYGPLIKFLIKKKIPTIWTFHCEFMYTGKCGHSHECNKWKTECNKCPLLHDYPKSYFLDFTTLMFRHKKSLFSNFKNLTIVTPSKWLESRVKQSFLSNINTRVIHNSLYLDNYPHFQKDKYFYRSKFGFNEKHKIILTIGNDILSDLKGGKILEGISNVIKDPTFIFIFVGTFENKTIGNNYYFKKTNDMEFISTIYSIADLVFIGSKRENFPTTALEALLHDKPIFGFKTGGTPETAPLPFGTFFNYLDTKSIISFITSFFTNKSLIPANEIRNFALSRYSPNIMINNYKKVYDEALTNL